jgi:phosphatidate cytidylyltransferase
MNHTNSPGWPRGITSFEARHGNARTRIVTAIVAIPIFIGAIILGGWAFFLLVVAISSGALLEFYWITEQKGASPDKGVGLLAGPLLAYAFMNGTPDVVLLITILLLLVVLTTMRALFRQEGSPLLNIMATLSGVCYVSLSLATLVGLRAGFGADATNTGYLLVIAIMVAIWICDSAAYFAGRGFGRHKLFERVSPKKTWEGAIGGAIGGTVGMIAMQQLFLPQLRLVDALVLGLIAGVFGQIGDLVESLLKRDAAVKDSSQLIPGHGGLLDRFDSLLFVAPLAWTYLAYTPPNPL